MKSNPSIYEINTRVWIKRFGVKSLANIPDSYWEILKSKGIDFVWLMGIWKTCDSLIEKYCFEEGLVKNYDRALKDWKKEDVIGSPFAIDMYEINPALGGKKALLALKKKLNKMGMGLILDFIPNHLGACSSLIKTNPELFLHQCKNRANQKGRALDAARPGATRRPISCGRAPARRRGRSARRC